MNQAEVKAFETNQFYREAVTLGMWDDKAKILGLLTPPIEDYRALVDAVSLR